ncbi:MAG: hypothetical protein ACE5HX_11430 [bacterium]
MTHLKINNQGKELDRNQEKLSIHAFHSSSALKSEIRKIISIHDKANKKIDQIYSQGPYIYLIFKKRCQNEIA